MLSLAELQKKLVENLDNSASENILDYVQSTAHFSAKNHLEIYRNSSIGALQQTLKNVYPVCYKLVGHDFFMSMSLKYIEQTPSFSSDIGDYGESFPNFIKTFEQAKSVFYLKDVAQLEWAWHKIFSAADNAIFDFTKLADCQVGERIIFLLPKGEFLLTSPYPVHQIWETNQENFSGDPTIHLVENTLFYYIIWRDQLELRIDPLLYPEWQILSWIKEKIAFGPLCENVAAHLPDVNITDLLPQLVKKGWIRDFYIAN